MSYDFYDGNKVIMHSEFKSGQTILLISDAVNEHLCIMLALARELLLTDNRSGEGYYVGDWD